MYTQASLTAFAVEYRWMNERTNEYQLQTVHKAKVQILQLDCYEHKSNL